MELMRAEGHEVGAPVCRAAIWACVKAGQWERALALFDGLEPAGTAKVRAAGAGAGADADAPGNALSVLTARHPNLPSLTTQVRIDAPGYAQPSPGTADIQARDLLPVTLQVRNASRSRAHVWRAIYFNPGVTYL